MVNSRYKKVRWKPSLRSRHETISEKRNVFTINLNIGIHRFDSCYFLIL